MTTGIKQPNARLDSSLLVKRMLVGAGFALALIALFISGAKTKPEWPDLWMLRPLVIVPIAGAGGAWFVHLMDRLSLQGGWLRLAAIIVAIIGYIIALWMGTVIGLKGTLWD